MAFDPVLAERIRAALGGVDAVTEKKMFGGLGFMVHGNMAAAAASGGSLMLRSSDAMADDLVDGDRVVEMEMRGRSMKGWLLVAPEAVADDEALQRLVDLAVAHVKTMPAQ
ncbi:TfoX/Sxy family protein [Aestuariimicrobium soli]|uniref:TfoX/Sxy family protein n=1 Tax=Aestuariimicrobium soli TaxID=2035834 RepID=UPI003EB7471F